MPSTSTGAAAFTRCWTKVARDQSAGAVVFTGAGKGFCAVSDLKRAAADTDDSVCRIVGTMLHDFQPTIECLTRMGKPLIAAVNGPEVGIGMSLTLADDSMMMLKTV